MTEEKYPVYLKTENLHFFFKLYADGSSIKIKNYPHNRYISWENDDRDPRVVLKNIVKILDSSKEEFDRVYNEVLDHINTSKLDNYEKEREDNG